MQIPIKAIIFDLGRVLIDFDHRIAARAIAGRISKSPEEVYRLFFDSALIQSFEEGKISPGDFFERVQESLGLAMGYDDFLSVWNGIFYITDENTRVYQLAKRLRGRHTIALLSNVNVLHFAHLKEHFPVFDVFDQIFTSYELGFVKPHPEIYRRALAALSVKPEEAFYVDDRAELIAQAQRLGIRGFVYTGFEQLKEDLGSCGVAVA